MKESIITVSKEKIAEFFIRAKELKTDVQLKEVSAEGSLVVSINYNSKAVLINLLAIARLRKKMEVKFPKLISKKQTTQKGDKNENQTI